MPRRPTGAGEAPPASGRSIVRRGSRCSGAFLRRLAVAGVLAWLSGCALAGNPIPQDGRSAGERVAPYADLTLANPPDLARVATATGIRLFNLAFVIAGKTCAPTWGGVVRYDDPGIAGRVRKLRAAGGDVRVSFGGADGVELAERCPSVEALTAAYQEVIDALDIVRVDFDIEGHALTDLPSVRRRNQAIRRLQANAQLRGRKLRVSFTLPAHASGLTGEATDLLLGARREGVDVEIVNIMAMNFGTAPPDLAAQVMAAAESTKTFVQHAWPGISEAQAWQKVAVTPMIGVNDIASERFRQGDAARLLEFAHRHDIGWLSFWSISRDRPCPDGAADDRAHPLCSGVTQHPGEFTEIFSAYARPAG
jgi:hypothetical protein